ncbi:MAG: GLUG motif-containing protein [Phycisphaerales bacterium]
MAATFPGLRCASFTACEWVVLALTTLFFLPIAAQAGSFAGGTGEPNDPYQIATPEQLISIGQDASLGSRHFILTSDIDLSGQVFSHTLIPEFGGVFDGNDHRILNLTLSVEEPTSFDGALFGWLASSAWVRNLGVEDVNIASRADAAALAHTNYGRLTNCHSSGCIESSRNLDGDRHAGGLVVFNHGHMANCGSRISVAGLHCAGGLVAANDTGIMMGCHSEGTVSGYRGGGSGGLGGLVGRNETGSSIVNCSSTAQIVETLAGGGFVGCNYGLVFCCYSEGDVRSFGAFVGVNGGMVSDCYSTGATTRAYCSGGFVGTNSGSLNNCWAAPMSSQGKVSAPVNGFVYVNSGRVTNCFWNTDTSGVVSDPNATGLTTDQMMSADTFLAAGWDFVGEQANGSLELWQMPEGGGYPVLSVFNGYVPPALEGHGTQGDPYLVSTIAELGCIHRDPEACYRLTDALDLSEVRFSGPPIPVFFGVFDGNGQSIRGLTVEGGDCLGLFGFLGSNAFVGNLAIEDVNIVGGDWIGGLGGYSHGRVVNCCSDGSIRGGDDLGGLVGYVEGGNILNSYSRASVVGGLAVGGLAGGMQSGHFANCYAAGVVVSDPSTESSEPNAGGLLAYNAGGVVQNCFWDVDVSGQASSAGGEGLTTAQMQEAGAFLAAGWDFTDETTNGLSQTWHMAEAGGYPVLSVLGGYYSPAFAGSGTVEDPFVISTAQELGAVGYAPAASYRLAASVDLSEAKWTIPPIPLFWGTFEGNGFAIRRLTIVGGEEVGLFGLLAATAVVRDLNIDDANVAGDSCVGILAGCNSGLISHCSSTGVVTCTDWAGGLVGYNDLGTISRSSSTASVVGERWLGGLVGYNGCTVIRESYSAGDIVCGYRFAGGLVAKNDYGTVTNCYSKTSVFGGNYIAGLIADSNGVVDNCYSCGRLAGNFRVGGLTMTWGDETTDCFWDREATGTDWSPDGTGLTTQAMQDSATFIAAGWDFVGESDNGDDDIWIGMVNDYPQLRWQHDE